MQSLPRGGITNLETLLSWDLNLTPCHSLACVWEKVTFVHLNYGANRLTKIFNKITIC